MQSAWRTHRFDVPDDLDDQSQLLFVARGPDTAPRYTLTVAHEVAVVGGVRAYVDGVLRTLATSVPGFRLVDRDNGATLAGQPAIVVRSISLTPTAQELAQRQGFGEDGEGGVYVVTATAHPHGLADADAAFDRLWHSFARLG